MEAIEFQMKRNKLIGEYHKEVHPLWLECQRRGKQAAFRRKIRPRLEKLFSDIARLKQG